MKNYNKDNTIKKFKFLSYCNKGELKLLQNLLDNDPNLIKEIIKNREYYQGCFDAIYREDSDVFYYLKDKFVETLKKQ